MAYEPSSSDNENYTLRKLNYLASDTEKDTSLAVGQYGATYAASGTITGRYGAIQALETALLNITASNWDNSPVSSVPVPAGVTIFGNISSFTVSGGKVIAYKNA